MKKIIRLLFDLLFPITIMHHKIAGIGGRYIMVLQRAKPLKIWGCADKGKKKYRFLEKHDTKATADGKWKIRIPLESWRLL